MDEGEKELFNFFESQLLIFWKVFAFSVFIYIFNKSYAPIFIDSNNCYIAIFFHAMNFSIYYFPLNFFFFFLAIRISFHNTIF